MQRMTRAVQAATALRAVTAGPAGMLLRARATRTYPGRLACALEAAIKRQHAGFVAMAQSHPQ